MTGLKNTSEESSVKSAVPVVFPANGSLQPKRRWKSETITTAPEVIHDEPVEKERPARFRHYRMKRSGHSHRVYPQVVAQIRPAPASLPAVGMAHQIVNLVRSISSR